MLNKSKEAPDNATLTSVKQETAKPRMDESEETAELNLISARVPEQPSTTVPGTVEKIIPSPRPSQPEKAQIAVEGSDHLYRDIRIENRLTDEDGNNVKLKKGAHVEVTVSQTGDVNHHN